MKAKANTSYPIMAFGGFEFVKYEWRDVPQGFESAAREHPNLAVQEAEPEPVAKPAPKPRPTRQRRTTKTARSKK